MWVWVEEGPAGGKTCGCRFRPGAPAMRALDTAVQGVDFMLS